MTPPLDAPRSWTIDAGTGWPAHSRENVDIDIDGGLSIRALTGRAEPLAGGDAVGSDRCPAALTADCDGTLIVLDGATGALHRVGHRCERTWATVGGNGTSVRRFFRPRGLALLPSGALAVADTGNNRVQVFAAATEALIHVVHGFNQPCDVVGDRRGRLFVADRGNSRVRVIAADGTWRRDLGAGYLQQPERLALSRSGALAVVDVGVNAVFVFTRGRRLPRVLSMAAPISAAFDPDGRLFLGDRRGSIHTFAESPAGSGRYELTGVAPTGLTRPILALASFGRPRALALLVEAPPEDELDLQGDTDLASVGRTLWRVDPAGGRGRDGVVISQAIDSGRERHRWQRVRVTADVPRGTTIDVDSATAEESKVPLAELPWKTCVRAASDNPDCLVQSAPGRYLWLRLRLRSNGRVSPVLHRITVSLGTSSYLQYLPAAFQEDEESRRFLDRFLAIFQSGFDDLNDVVDTLVDLFEPLRTRASFLPWLAQWIGLLVDPTWTEAELRDRIAEAIRTYGRRGTADGLQAAIRAYAGVDARIVEHYRLRQLARLSESSLLDGSAALWSPARTQRLQLGSYSQLGLFRLTSWPEPAVEALEWGAHRFTVLFDAAPYAVAETADRVARVVEREKPAHTAAAICPVFPRMRVGVQARLGIDASVGDITYMVLSRLSTLNYDSILGCSGHERALAASGTGRHPRVGETARLA